MHSLSRLSKIVLLLLSIHGCVLGQLFADSLTLTDQQGREITAEILDYNGEKITIRREDGAEFQLPLASLSAESKKAVNTWLEKSGLPIFTPQDIVRYPFEISVRETSKKYNDTSASIRIKSARGTKPTFEQGGEYLIIGEFYCPDYDEEFLFFGVENGNDADSNGYSRFHRPKEKETKFKAGLRIKGPGKALLGVFSDQKPKWRTVLYLEAR
ncbi:hypothetical protein [Cerasicoccus frondis]|uniref:hypothetical protein n=1 Tax=Cerasicoccus frondis TaxID=490090 RepID=UPI0028524F14|nr:hypothetical protein [Cerasicoccus frondis]